MPIITVKISAAPDAATIERVGAGVAELTQGILHKDPNFIAITIEAVAPANWFVAGRSLVDHGKSSFFLDVKVVHATNTKDEKARYVAEIFDFMERAIGPLHSESYVYVDEVSADAYGFGGKTQEHRYIARQLTPA